jgi:hypothetical protein
MVLVLESKGVVYTRGLGSWPLEPHDAMGHGSIIPSNFIFQKKRENMILLIIFSRLQRATIL